MKLNKLRTRISNTYAVLILLMIGIAKIITNILEGHVHLDFENNAETNSYE